MAPDESTSFGRRRTATLLSLLVGSGIRAVAASADQDLLDRVSPLLEHAGELDGATLGKAVTSSGAAAALRAAPFAVTPRAGGSRPHFHVEASRGKSYFNAAGYQSQSFSPSPFLLEPQRRYQLATIPMATTAEASELTKDSEETVYNIRSDGLTKGERYIAMNRFNLRDGAGPKFEARWANRKSRLASLDGFRYFTLMRRVAVPGIMESYSDDFSYVSFTIWEDKPAFNAWRTGDAFKEAHGGTSIGAFLTTMVSSLFVIKGPPSPIFWDGIAHQAITPEAVPETEGGWRMIEANGKDPLPTEAFVACNRFAVISGQEKAFEDLWTSRESKLKEMPGFVSFTMLRRDFKTKMHGSDKALKPGDEYNYMSTTVWQDKAAFMKWRESKQFKSSHGPKKGEGEDATAAKPPKMWEGAPQSIFYEGVLVISSQDGA